MERMRENPRVREWWRMTDSWQESLVPGARSSEAGSPAWWKPIEEVFHID
jgi:L-rhamnose mutarotase